MNIFEFKNTKAGFTLIEMVITLAILSVLMTSTMGMIISSNSIFISTSQAALDKQVGNGVFSLVESIVKYSTHLQISSSKDATMTQNLSINEIDTTNHSGYVLYYNKEYDSNNSKEPTNLFDTSYYSGNRTVKYNIQSVGGDGRHLKITVWVYRDGEAVYETSSIIKCLNLGLASGSSTNNIVVKNDAPAYNQVISFSCDEMLLSGGESAWSIEYKVNEYLAKYNKILKSYFEHLVAANSPVTSMYSNYKDKTGSDAIFKSVAETTLNTRSQAVYGTTYKDISSAKNFDQILVNKTDSIVGNSKWNSLVSWTEGTTDPSAWKNIRAYYQKEIYDLLKYSPTTITDSTNPYYMIICGKEELYTGFLLTYYDKNKDGKVTQAEYPNFGSTASEIANFFGGTTLQKYADGSFNNDSMVILGYFVDNETSSYQTDYYKKNAANMEVQAEVTEDRLKNDSEGGPWKWVASDGGSSYYPAPILTSDSIKTEKSSIASTINYSSLPYKTMNKMFYVINATSNDVYKGYDWNEFGWGWSTNYHKWIFRKYTTSISGNIVSASYTDDSFTYESDGFKSVGYINDNYFLSQADVNRYYSFNTAALYLMNNLGGAVTGFTNARNIASYCTYSSGNYGYDHTNVEGKRIEFIANSDLPEGWYYYSYNAGKIAHVDATQGLYKLKNNTEDGVVYVFFFLKADYGTISGSQNYNQGKIAVSKDRTIHLFMNNSNEMNWFSYQQAQYVGAGGTGAIEKLEYETWSLPKAHQYSDWILYGVDWNSWFSNSTGLINGMITGIKNWVGGLISNTYVDTISSVSASNATLSLGRTGIYEANNIDYRASSYNLAWMVYNASKGSWYYLPQQSTIASTYLSGLSFVSSKDQPRALDLQNDIGSSTWLEYLINNRKYYNKVVGGKGDVNWVTIPTTAEKVTG